MDIPKEAKKVRDRIKSSMDTSLMANTIAEKRAKDVDWLVAQATPRFQWTCGKGCGDCGVKRIEFEYSRTEELDGTLIESKTIPRLVSDCCGALLMMWDNEKDEEVDIFTEAAFASPVDLRDVVGSLPK